MGIDTYLLTMQNNFSRHVSAVPLKTKEAVEVARNLIDHYIAVYGCPLQIHSDNGTELKNTVWAEVMRKLRVKQTKLRPITSPLTRWKDSTES